jgi:dolichol-phosphate mannosyltransferase
MDSTVVIIPTYNERENLERIVARVRVATPDVQILVVDDNSPDGTGDIADRLAAADSAVHVLHRTGKEGLGAAYKAGFAPEQLPSLLAAAADADVVLGSRWVPGGSVVNWPKHREAISRVGSGYARFALRLPARDVTGGYRVFSADALRRLQLDEVHSHGYGFQVDMLWHANRAGLSIVEVPITFTERALGASKMTGGIVVEAMLRVTWWGICEATDRVIGRHPEASRATAGS